MHQLTRSLVAALALGAASTPSLAAAETLEEIFDRANAAYFRGEHDAAAEDYQRLLELGVVDPDVSYNLATTEARRARYGAAIQHFERALFLRPGDVDARTGLDVARAAAGRRRAERQGAAEVDTAPPLSEALFGGISRSTLAVAALALSFVFFGALIGLLFVRKESLRIGLGVAAPLSFVLFAVSFAGLAIRAGWLEEGEPGVVLPQRLALREGPGEDSTERHRAAEGERAWILESHEEWLRVRVPAVGEGWVGADSIGHVRPQ